VSCRAFDHSGKVCVITGAAGGIGSATAERFSQEGAIVVGVDLRDDSPGDLALALDVTDEDAVAEMYKQVEAKYGRIDVLFNIAGISHRRRLRPRHHARVSGAYVAPL